MERKSSKNKDGGVTPNLSLKNDRMECRIAQEAEFMRVRERYGSVRVPGVDRLLG